MDKKRTVKKSPRRKSVKKTDKNAIKQVVEKTPITLKPPRNSVSDDERMMNSIMKGEVTDELLKEIRETFSLFDADNDGKVSREEITTIVRALGMFIRDSDINAMLESVDSDGNGSVDYSEFEAFMLKSDMLKQIPDETDQDMLAAFQILDKDKNGYIERDELKYYMTKFGDKMSDEDADKMILEADKNGDGKIDYHEYVAHMSSKI